GFLGIDDNQAALFPGGVHGQESPAPVVEVDFEAELAVAIRGGSLVWPQLSDRCVTLLARVPEACHVALRDRLARRGHDPAGHHGLFLRVLSKNSLGAPQKSCHGNGKKQTCAHFSLLSLVATSCQLVGFAAARESDKLAACRYERGWQAAFR